jgi:hypothetical protein
MINDLRLKFLQFFEECRAKRSRIHELQRSADLHSEPSKIVVNVWKIYRSLWRKAEIGQAPFDPVVRVLAKRFDAGEIVDGGPESEQPPYCSVQPISRTLPYFPPGQHEPPPRL